MDISQIKQHLDREYNKFIQSQSYQSYKNSEIHIRGLFFGLALKGLKYPNSQMIPLGGGIYKFKDFNHFDLNVNLFDAPQFKNKAAFINWLSTVLQKHVYQY